MTRSTSGVQTGKSLTTLDVIPEASPCFAPLVSTPGDDRVRVCVECGLKTYNVSAMSPEEARSYLRAKAGPEGTRFYRRKDGTILTRDCPRAAEVVGRGKPNWTLRLLVVAVLLIAFARFVESQPGGWIRYSRWGGWIPDVEPFRFVVHVLDPPGHR